MNDARPPDLRPAPSEEPGAGDKDLTITLLIGHIKEMTRRLAELRAEVAALKGDTA